MNLHEAEALMQYIRERLLDHTEQFVNRVDDDVVGDMYDGVYDIMQDLELTLDMQMAMDLKPANVKKK